MNIDDLTIREGKQLAAMFYQARMEPSGMVRLAATANTVGLSAMIGKKVIIRTYSAGVHFGTLAEKSGTEVILHNVRRLWRWFAKKGVCTHGVAEFGIVPEKSKICSVIPELWLDAIEIIPCSKVAIDTIEGASDVSPE